MLPSGRCCDAQASRMREHRLIGRFVKKLQSKKSSEYNRYTVEL